MELPWVPLRQSCDAVQLHVTHGSLPKNRPYFPVELARALVASFERGYGSVLPSCRSYRNRQLPKHYCGLTYREPVLANSDASHGT